MDKFILNPKISSTLGFIFLPFTVSILLIAVNVFTPKELQFPSPRLIINEIVSSFGNKVLISALLTTLYTLIKSITISLIIGVLLGLILGLNKTVWNLTQPTIDFFRSIPVTFLIPAMALLIGVTSKDIIWMLSSYPCMLIIIFSVRTGIGKQEEERIHAFYIINGSVNHIKRFMKITFYEILPDIFSGFRIALSYCIVIITVLEYMRLGNETGVGGLINDELQMLNYARVYSMTFIIGAIGFLLNKIVEVLQTKYFHWSILD